MSVYGKLIVDEEDEEGEIELSASFKREGWLFKADMLKDWISELTTEYNKIVTTHISS